MIDSKTVKAAYTDKANHSFLRTENQTGISRIVNKMNALGGIVFSDCGTSAKVVLKGHLKIRSYSVSFKQETL